MTMIVRPTRLYQDRDTGATDPLLWRLALTRPSLTISRAFSVGFEGTWKDSPFAEFTCVPAPCPQVDRLPRERRTVSPAEAAEILLPVIRQQFADTWQPDKFHYVYHSSGYDSRVLSGCIRSLYHQWGYGWLGELVFACNKWEAIGFREIMGRQGWKPEQFYVHNVGVEEAAYFAPHIRLEHCYETLNSPCPIPANLWNYLPRAFDSEWGLPLGTRCQGYSGYWANEVTESFLTSETEWCSRWNRWYSYNVMASLPMYFDDMVFPFLSPEYQWAVAGLYVPGADAGAVRKALADLACPDCADIPNMALSDRHHPIAAATRERMVREYQATWYGQHVQPYFVVPATSEFSPDWGKWSLASLCDFLRAQGVTIKVN